MSDPHPGCSDLSKRCVGCGHSGWQACQSWYSVPFRGCSDALANLQHSQYSIYIQCWKFETSPRPTTLEEDLQPFWLSFKNCLSQSISPVNTSHDVKIMSLSCENDAATSFSHNIYVIITCLLGQCYTDHVWSILHSSRIVSHPPNLWGNCKWFIK